MPVVLIFAEQQADGRMRRASLNAVEAGRQLADPVPIVHRWRIALGEYRLPVRIGWQTVCQATRACC